MDLEKERQETKLTIQKIFEEYIVLCLYNDGKKGESWHVVYDNYIEAKRYYKKEKKKKFQIVRIYQAKELDSR